MVRTCQRASFHIVADIAQQTVKICTIVCEVAEKDYMKVRLLSGGKLVAQGKAVVTEVILYGVERNH